MSSATPPGRPGIVLRPAVVSDLPALADLAVEAFSQSPIDFQFFPRHVLYPEQHRSFFLREFRFRLSSPDQVVIVAETSIQSNLDHATPYENLPARPAPETKRRKQSRRDQVSGVPKDLPVSQGREEIIGYAAWIRFGPRTPNFRHDIWGQDSIPKQLQRLSLHFQALHSLIWCHIGSLRTIRSFHLQAGNIVKGLDLESWVDLSAIAVKPNWQRNGVGQILANWGLNVADSESIACVLEATGEGTGLYEKLGFRPVGEVILEGRKVVAKRGGWINKKQRRDVVQVPAIRMPVMLRSAREPITSCADHKQRKSAIE